MSQVDTRIFKLNSLTPIGFKINNYPVKICLLCRGSLSEVCNSCMEKGLERCTVTNQNESYYHTHCHSFMNNANQKSKTKKKYESDSE